MVSNSKAAAIAYVALGSNLQDPQQQVRLALDDLGTLENSRVLARSSLYRSAPVGYLDQPDFINAVAKIETTLAPIELLHALLSIEQKRRRVREFTNSPRTLDLDLLMYNNLILHQEGLTIPHPRMHERSFVLVPLHEISPDAVIPGRGKVVDLLVGCDTQALQKTH